MKAYDGHMNLILSDVEEIITLVDGDESLPSEARVKVSVPSITLASYRIVKEEDFPRCQSAFLKSCILK